MSMRPGGNQDALSGRAFPSDAEWVEIGSRLGWSGRELRVARSLAGGASCKRTAFLERLAVSTVHTYRRRAMRKARVGTLPGLIWAVVGARDEVRCHPDETRAARSA